MSDNDQHPIVPQQTHDGVVITDDAVVDQTVGEDVVAVPGMLDVSDPLPVVGARMVMAPDLVLGVPDPTVNTETHGTVEEALETLGAVPLSTEAASMDNEDALEPKQEDESLLPAPADLHAIGHHPGADATDKETSAMIAQAAAAAVASVGGEGASEDATAAALAVKPEPQVEDEEARAKRNEQRRKRYREKADEGSIVSGSSKTLKSHEEQLASRRLKDRERYAAMSGKQRQQYNEKRRDQYHRQSEESRQKRRERERNRYHSLADTDAKERNARRAKLERERYQRLSATELENKNKRRRERAASMRKRSKEGSVGSEQSGYTGYTGYTGLTGHTGHADASMADASQLTGQGVEQPAVKHEGIKNSAAAEEAVKEAVKEAVEEAVAKSDIVSI